MSRSEDSQDTGAEGLRDLPGSVSSTASRLNNAPSVLTAMKRLREVLPGDSRYGDSISLSVDNQRLLDRQIAILAERHPTLLREAGLGALQVWGSLTGGDVEQPDRELAIAFTDLAGFSSWALEAGDDAALDLLRNVGEAIEPPVREVGGEVVKRLGDGMMAVFSEPVDALAALIDARQRVERVSAPGYEPRIRAGLHVGRPRRLGGDFLGRDVNIAARIAERAEPSEVLISGWALERLGDAPIETKRRRRFKAKGVPREVEVFAVAQVDQ
ncbi:MAG: adenylate/guanylate cyclase domain-containing protein [Solirubrobacterales bacterium]|nr:adenylate/guanylate cyclase domain-containing protein [Solirubrobacterales bacterium]